MKTAIIKDFSKYLLALFITLIDPFKVTKSNSIANPYYTEKHKNREEFNKK